MFPENLSSQLDHCPRILGSIPWLLKTLSFDGSSLIAAPVLLHQVNPSLAGRMVVDGDLVVVNAAHQVVASPV